jgi:hypothetical protein
VSYEEQVRITAALADAIERASAAVREMDRAREAGDSARLRVALGTYAACEDEMARLRKRQAELHHGRA